MKKMTKKTDKYRKPFFFVLSALIVLIVLFIIFCTKSSQIASKRATEGVLVDSVVVTEVKYVEVPKEVIKYVDRVVVDSIYVYVEKDDGRKDSIPVSKESKHYQDSISDIWISGYQPSIDSIEYHIPYQTIEKTVMVEREKKWYEDRFVITAGVGCGYGLLTKQPDVFVGIHCGIRLW